MVATRGEGIPARGDDNDDSAPLSVAYYRCVADTAAWDENMLDRPPIAANLMSRSGSPTIVSTSVSSAVEEYPEERSPDSVHATAGCDAASRWFRPDGHVSAPSLADPNVLSGCY